MQLLQIGDRPTAVYLDPDEVIAVVPGVHGLAAVARMETESRCSITLRGTPYPIVVDLPAKRVLDLLQSFANQRTQRS